MILFGIFIKMVKQTKLFQKWILDNSARLLKLTKLTIFNKIIWIGIVFTPMYIYCVVYMIEFFNWLYPIIKHTKRTHPLDAHNTSSLSPLSDLVNCMLAITGHSDRVSDDSGVTIPIRHVEGLGVHTHSHRCRLTVMT
jgi:hypothetical protein